MPTAAVRWAGSPTVSSGSRITRPGIIRGWKMIRLVCSARASVMTEARPVSEPVPEVVGTATTGSIPSFSARVHQSSRSSKSQMGRDWAAMNPIAFPTSRALPPPKAMSPS